MRRRSSPAATAAMLGICLFLLACGPPKFHIPAPVPPSLHEHVVASPFTDTWEASLRALDALGLPAAETEPAQQVIVSNFRGLPGNSERERNRGVARVAVERDIYSAGRERLVVTLAALEPDRIEVRVAARIQAKVERRGEIRYATAGGEDPALSLAGGGAAVDSEEEEAGWESLTSNGVLEDRFLAALVTELSLPDSRRPVPPAVP